MDAIKSVLRRKRKSGITLAAGMAGNTMEAVYSALIRKIHKIRDLKLNVHELHKTKSCLWSGGVKANQETKVDLLQLMLEQVNIDPRRSCQTLSTGSWTSEQFTKSNAQGRKYQGKHKTERLTANKATVKLIKTGCLIKRIFSTLWYQTNFVQGYYLATRIGSASDASRARTTLIP